MPCGDKQPTHIVILTPPGRGAIASISVQGPGACSFVAQCLTPASGRSFAEAPTGHIIFGRWGAQAEGEELIVSRRSAEDVEIHCHGGTAAVAAVVGDLARLGCVEAEAQRWTEVNGANLIEAEARQSLLGARTQHAASILLDQLGGALADEITAIRNLCGSRTRQSSANQATASNRSLTTSATRCATLLSTRCAALLATAPVGQHLTVPWKVVLAGAANVGKSSLINALVGFERAIVFDTPGTTRDAVSASTAIDGYSIELIDTAGIRSGGDPIERAGIEQSRRQLAGADLVVLVTDAGRPVSDDECRLIETIPDALVVHNKTDLPPAHDIRRPGGLPISALTGTRIGDLLQAIRTRLIPNPPQPGDAILFTPRQVDLLKRCCDALSEDDHDQARSLLDRISGTARSIPDA